jgi:hypothetical protein
MKKKMTFIFICTAHDTLVTKLLAVLVFFFLVSCVDAEIINGPANIREKPEGKITAVLKDGVEVEMVPPYISAKSWLSVGFVAYVDRNAIIKNQKKPEVKGHYLLYDKQGRIIGKTIETFKIGWDIGEENGRVGIVIEKSYTYKDNIRADTIPEYELKNLLDTTEAPILKDKLTSFLNKYNFEKWPLVKDKEIEDYFIYESWIYDISPMPRLQLIYYKNRLVSVIHRNLLMSNKFKSKELFREMKIMNLEKMDTKLSKRIQEEIVEPLKTAD